MSSWVNEASSVLMSTYAAMMRAAEPELSGSWRPTGTTLWRPDSGSLVAMQVRVFPAVSYTHLTLPTTARRCRSRWSPCGKETWPQSAPWVWAWSSWVVWVMMSDPLWWGKPRCFQCVFIKPHFHFGFNRRGRVSLIFLVWEINRPASLGLGGGGRRKAREGIKGDCSIRLRQK